MIDTSTYRGSERQVVEIATAKMQLRMMVVVKCCCRGSRMRMMRRQMVRRMSQYCRLAEGTVAAKVLRHDGQWDQVVEIVARRSLKTIEMR